MNFFLINKNQFQKYDSFAKDKLNKEQFKKYKKLKKHLIKKYNPKYDSDDIEELLSAFIWCHIPHYDH